MRIIVVDDEQFALDHLKGLLEEFRPNCEIHCFSSPISALKYMKKTPADVALLDVEMYEMSGIELAKKLKDIYANVNIIFVTGYSDYALDAFSIHASGYLLKPTSGKQLERELNNLRIEPRRESNKRVRVQTFGNFEVFVDNEPIEFARTKSKELLAYLVDRKGAGTTTAALIAVLWEDKEYSVSLQKQFQTLVSDLMKTLKYLGVEDIIIRKRNNMYIHPDKIDCDYYSFLKGDAKAVNAYTGEYMSNYSWAEFTMGFLHYRSQRSDW